MVLGHGTPIDSGDGGVAAPFMLDGGVASSARIAAFWGLAAPRQTPRRVDDTPATDAATSRDNRPTAGGPARAKFAAPRNDVAHVIGAALRAAGLLK